MLKIYLTGIFILTSAIVFNVLAQVLGLMGWYGFLTRLAAEGKTALRSVRIFDYLWMFIAYPFLLGLVGWLSFRWLNR